MKFFIGIFCLLILSSCTEVKEKVNVKSNTSFDPSKTSMSTQDNFDDFKKKDDESCEDEEALKKKLIPKKLKAFKLQGGDAGCDVSELQAK